jgi:hypothetical protein
LIIAISTLLLTGAHSKMANANTEKKYCKGYSVIEVDKGVDCYGDTIKLVKVNGFFERAL